MKKIVFVMTLCYYSFAPLMAQNVGVGTQNPLARMEVRDTAKTKLLIASKSYLDSSQIVLSNRTASNLGTDMIISSNRENGLQFTSQSDLSANNNDSILTLLPTGRIGINDPTPSERLDVNGNMNITGIIKANGNPGLPNQVLMQNESGNLTWGNLGNTYKNYDAIYATGSGTWTVPANVTSIMVELTGAGSGGNAYGGGAGGGYIMAQLDVTPGSNINYTIGTGSLGTSVTNTLNGGSSSVSTGTVSLTAEGGYGATYNSTLKSFSSAGGGMIISGGFRNYISIFGASGLMGRSNFMQRSASTFMEEVSGADGGGPGYCRTCTAKGAYVLFDIATSSVLQTRYGLGRSYPGTGGSGGYFILSPSSGYSGGSFGANGLVIIRY